MAHASTRGGAKPLRRLIVLAASTAALGYLAICVLLWSLQERLIYLPSRTLVADPGHWGLAYQDLRLTTEDGVEIHGWWIPHEDSRATVLFCHGNAGNISHRGETVRLLHGLGCDVLVFDYRGYGASGGEPSEEGTYRDALACLRWLEERSVPRERLVLMGRSLGGGVAIGLAAHARPAALIVESSFSSLSEFAAERYPLVPVALLLRHRYPSAERLAVLDVPCLVLHSADDEMIPIAHGRRLAASAGARARFVELAGGHNDAASGDAYRQALDGFLSEVLPLAAGADAAR